MVSKKNKLAICSGLSCVPPIHCAKKKIFFVKTFPHFFSRKLYYHFRALDGSNKKTKNLTAPILVWFRSQKVTSLLFSCFTHIFPTTPLPPRASANTMIMINEEVPWLKGYWWCRSQVRYWSLCQIIQSNLPMLLWKTIYSVRVLPRQSRCALTSMKKTPMLGCLPSWSHICLFRVSRLLWLIKFIPNTSYSNMPLDGLCITRRVPDFPRKYRRG